MSPFLDTPGHHDPALPEAVLNEAGKWTYADTSIVAVGARDVTLAEKVRPRLIARADAEPEAVLIALDEIIANQRLNWVLQVGERLTGDKGVIFFKVQWPKWQEHAAEPVDVWLPERDGSGLDRRLAIAERDFRFAKQAFEAAGETRNKLIVLATRLGRSRREVGELLGLTPGRIQQLNEDPTSEISRETVAFLSEAADVARVLEAASPPVKDVPTPDGFGSDHLEETVVSMRDLGLLSEAEGGIHLTEDGLTLLDMNAEAPKRSRARNRVGNRKRAGNASR